ncbi:hypothetical protein IAT38_007871 [Cryptococcus sp. DSM 104549]
MMFKFDLKIACIGIAVLHQQAAAIPQMNLGSGGTPNPNSAATSDGPAFFDPATGPTCDDIKQSSTVTAVTLKVWDPDTLKETDQHVTLGDTAVGNGNDDSSAHVWWPSAIQAAVVKHGGSGIEDGKFNDDGGFAFAALSYLTGKEADSETDSSKWWDMLKAHVDTSPIAVCTNNKNLNKLEGGHCYTAMTIAKDGSSDGDRKLKLHNPWGDTQDYKYSDIKSDIAYISHLKNWDTY